MKLNLQLAQVALREAERELDVATTKSELNAAAKRFMRAKAELKALTAEQPA